MSEIDFEPVIGMEVHVELQTLSKMFCGCKVGFGGEPNTRCCPVCLGLPGSLPVVNQRAVDFMAKTALALNCKINPTCIFHRKNYYYPDLPKNYQISQYDIPLGVNGFVEITVNGTTKMIAVRRVHMEEDTGKLLHVDGNRSLIDYNRSGVPLMEIVTMNPPPVGMHQIESAEEAREYLQKLRAILVYLDVSDCKMEEGSLRCEPNISIRPKGRKEFGTKTEIKNLNSFRAVYLGVQYEMERQETIVRRGEKIVQETRRWDDSRGVTSSMRTKEVEQEYRYFPEPDIAPIRLSVEHIESLCASLPEMPAVKLHRFVNEFGLSYGDAGVLTDSPELADYYETCVQISGDPKSVANWIMGEFLRLLNATGSSLGDNKLTPELLCGLLRLIECGIINRKIAKIVFEEMFNTGKPADEIVASKGLTQVTDECAIEAAVDKVLFDNSDAIVRYKAGEDKLIGFFVGQVMRELKGKANPEVTNKLLQDKLSKI